MKQIRLLTIAILLIATTSHAQINKGSFALGGNLSFSTLTSKSESFKQHQTSVWVSPSLITFYKNNQGLGFNLSYSHLDSDPSGTSNSYGAGVFLRQYKTLGKGFYIFAQEALGYNYSKGSIDSTTSTSFVNSTSHELSISVNPGIAYDLSKRFQLELLFFNNFLSASYEHSKLEMQPNGANAIKLDAFSLGANLTASQLTSLNIGAKIFFGR